MAPSFFSMIDAPAPVPICALSANTPDKVGIFGQHVGGQAHALRFFIVGDAVADDLEIGIGVDAVHEALVAGIQQFMPRHGGDIADFARRLAGALLDAVRHGVRRRLAARLVVGGEEGSVFVGLGAGIDDDDGNARRGHGRDRSRQAPRRWSAI